MPPLPPKRSRGDSRLGWRSPLPGSFNAQAILAEATASEAEEEEEESEADKVEARQSELVNGIPRWRIDAEANDVLLMSLARSRHAHAPSSVLSSSDGERRVRSPFRDRLFGVSGSGGRRNGSGIGGGVG
ncbi:unnamed protein product, partial [Laminaria digitata]